MLLKCPHCNQVKEYSETEYRRIFIRCKACAREFRAAECSPLTGREARDRVEILEMASAEAPKGRLPGAPAELKPETGGRVAAEEGPRPRRRFLQRFFGRSG